MFLGVSAQDPPPPRLHLAWLPHAPVRLALDCGSDSRARRNPSLQDTQENVVSALWVAEGSRGPCLMGWVRSLRKALCRLWCSSLCIGQSKQTDEES